MYGRGTPLGSLGSVIVFGIGIKSAKEGSGVESLNELMYLVSAISRFSSISSRSSMSKANRSVSLSQSLVHVCIQVIVHIPY